MRTLAIAKLTVPLGCLLLSAPLGAAGIRHVAAAHPTPTNAAATPSTPASGRAIDPGIRRRYQALTTDSGHLAHVETLLVSRCMRAAGFTYPVDPDVPTPTQDNPYGLSVTQAEQGGYQSESHVLLIPDVPGDKDMPRDPAARATYSRALSGGPAAGMTDLHSDLLGFSGGGPATGCQADAERTLYGNLDNAVLHNLIGANALNAGLATAAQDPRVHELNRQWSACMTAAGRPGYRDPAAAIVDARRRSDNNYDALAQGTARQIAVADATCQQNLDYAAARQRVEDQELTRMLHDHAGEFIRIEAAGREAATRAHEIA